MTEHTAGEESPTIEGMEARVEKMLDEAFTGKKPDEPPQFREPLFSVLTHPDGGFQSRFLFDAIDMACLGPQRETAEECVEDCKRALVGLLGQLGINPEDCSVMLVQVSGLTPAEPAQPESATP